MDDSVEAIYGDILIKFKKLLLEEGENEITSSKNLIYVFYDTFGEGHGLNRGK